MRRPPLGLIIAMTIGALIGAWLGIQVARVVQTPPGTPTGLRIESTEPRP